MRSKSEISVIMSVHNGASRLRESIDSILAQAFHDFEFIIIDDASTDHSLSIIRERQQSDSRIIVLTNEENTGLAASLNEGLRVAQGKYIARQDADDASLPERLQRQYEYLESHPAIILLGAAAILHNDDGRETAVLRYPADEEALRRNLPRENQVLHPTMMFRNDGAHFYREKFRYAQDYDFLLRLLSDGKRIANLPDILIRRRQDLWSLPDRKDAQQLLFAEAAKEFCRQRASRGSDDYERFDPAPILSIDIDRTENPLVLRSFIEQSFRASAWGPARAFIRRYWRAHGYANKYALIWAGTFLGKAPLDVLRRVKRKMNRSHPVDSLGSAPSAPLAATVRREGGKPSHKPSLALFLSNGSGLADWARNGSLSREVAVYRRFSEDGWKVSFFTYDLTRQPPPLDFAASVHTQWPFLLPRRLHRLYFLLMPVIRWRHGRGVDVIITNQAHSGWPAIIAAKIWGARVIARCGWVFGESAETRGYTGWRTRLVIHNERWTFRHADVCVVPTRELADWIIGNYAVAPEKVTVIPNFVDTESFRPDPAAPPGIDVLCVGRLAEQKRYLMALDALKGTGAKIEIIGQGPLEEPIRERASQNAVDLALINRVPNETIPAHLNNAKVYLIASDWEGHPKSLIEAMACGCACVGTRSPGIVGQIVDGETGLLVDSTPQSIAQAVQRLLNDSGLRRRLGENARQYAVENWSFDKVYARYAALMESQLHPALRRAAMGKEE